MTVTRLAVLVVAFERPAATRAVLEVLSNYGSADVAIFQDGPRDSLEAAARHKAVRDVIREFEGGLVSDYCGLRQNAGCAFGVSKALRWFFSKEESGVILEDDCLPTTEFLDYCATGLENHRRDQRVGSIGGQGYSIPAGATPGRSVLSRYPQIWGWATWRDRLDDFRVVVPDWRDRLETSPQWKELGVIERRDWRKTFRSVATTRPHTWDAQLVLHQWTSNRYSLLPPVPMVENIGFGELATHTSGDKPSWVQPLGTAYQRSDAVRHLASPSQPPKRDLRVDEWLSSNVYSPSLSSRLRRRLQSS